MSDHSTPNARKGKIARLPYETREEINRRLLDGQTAAQINDWLGTVKAAGAPFSDQNFTNWRHGGYRDWLAEQERLHTIRANAETVRRSLEAGGLYVVDQGLFEIAQKLTDAVSGSPELAAKLTPAIVAIKNAVTAAARAEHDRKKTDLAAQSLALEKQKFARQTAALFLDWYNDQRARDIAAATDASTEDKIDRLGALMFGEDWK